MRKKIVAGNWKMNKTLDDAHLLTSEVMAMIAEELKGDVQVILCVPFPYLMAIRNQFLASHSVIA